LAKVVYSWSKPDGVAGLIARKQVDKSMFFYGSHIPIEFHEDFSRANGGSLPERDESHNVILVYGGQEYVAELSRQQRKDSGSLLLELRYRQGGPFAEVLRKQLEYTYRLVSNLPGGIDAESIPAGDREYVEFYETGVPYRYVVNLVPRTAASKGRDGDWPFPKGFDDVWADLGRVLGTQSEISTLAGGKRNVVSWREREGIEVTTDQGRALLRKTMFEETWDTLLQNGVLSTDNLPGEAQYRSAAVTAIFSQLPYVDHTTHPRIAIFYIGHLFTNNVISSTLGVGTQGGIRIAGRAPETKQVVFITSSSGDTELDHPYQDRWEGDTFFYTGEGLTGDQELTRGNVALRNSMDQGFPLYGFRKLEGGGYRFIGRFKVQGVEEEQQPDTTGTVRTVYVFRMERVRKVAGLEIPVVNPPAGPRLPESNPDLTAITTTFSTALAASHINFGPRHEELVRSFIAGLGTKRFVILTGLSGSGKTQIALRFGDWLGKDRRMVVPVRPDWTGPDALFGYEDALRPATDGGRKPWYVPPVLEFMLKAAQDSEHPYLLVLDEMNLAHVERYFADFLSGIESDEPCLPNLVREDTGDWLVPEGAELKIELPRNLFVVGTVNVDETTYMFSPKVLDRANTYEFRVATEDLQDALHKPTMMEPGPDDLVRGFLAVAFDDAWQDTHPAPERQRFADHLRQLHRLLAEGDFEFGHRVFYEANRYAAMLASAGNASLEDALDQQVYQKVLPRLHGSRRRLEPTLRALGRFCWDLTVDTTNEPGKAFDPEAPGAGQAKLPLSFQKVRRMFRSLQANQFTSFTE